MKEKGKATGKAPRLVLSLALYVMVRAGAYAGAPQQVTRPSEALAVAWDRLARGDREGARAALERGDADPVVGHVARLDPSLRTLLGE